MHQCLPLILALGPSGRRPHDESTAKATLNSISFFSYRFGCRPSSTSGHRQDRLSWIDRSFVSSDFSSRFAEISWPLSFTRPRQRAVVGGENRLDPGHRQRCAQIEASSRARS